MSELHDVRPQHRDAPGRLGGHASPASGRGPRSRSTTKALYSKHRGVGPGPAIDHDTNPGGVLARQLTLQVLQAGQLGRHRPGLVRALRLQAAVGTPTTCPTWPSCARKRALRDQRPTRNRTVSGAHSSSVCPRPAGRPSAQRPPRCAGARRSRRAPPSQLRAENSTYEGLDSKASPGTVALSAWRRSEWTGRERSRDGSEAGTHRAPPDGWSRVT
jgi:hypothetical protein